MKPQGAILNGIAFVPSHHLRCYLAMLLGGRMEVDFGLMQRPLSERPNQEYDFCFDSLDIQR